MSHPDGRAPLAPGGRRWPTQPRALPQRPPPPTQARTGRAAAGIDWLPTLAARGAGRLQHEHLRWRARPQQEARLHLIALDVSGSMLRQGRLAGAKAFAARLIDEATRAGDQVALLVFGGQGVQLLLAPGPARRAAIGRVRPLGSGGGTPLAACLEQAQQLLLAHRRRSGPGPRQLWLLSDGRSLEQAHAPAAADHIVVVDFDDPQHPIGRCADWARRWGAELRQPALPRAPFPPIP